MVRGVPQGMSPPSKIGGFGRYVNGDIIVLVCRMILQNQVIKGSCDFMGSSPLR